MDAPISRRGQSGVAAAILLAALLGEVIAAPVAAGTNFWTPLGPDGGSVSTVVADPSHPQILYAGSRGGVFKSINGGMSWQPASRGLLIHPITALAVDPQQPGTVYTTAGDESTLGIALAVSRDGGATWTQEIEGSNGYARDGGDEIFSSLAVDPAHRGTVFAASNFVIYVSHDSGRTWKASQNYDAVNPQEGVSVQLAADPARGSVFAYVIALQSFDGPFVKLLESSDGGATWNDRSAALPAGAGGSLAIEPTAPGILFLIQGTTLFRSVDGAASWQQAHSGARGPIAAGAHGLVIAGSTFGAALKSADGGRSWQTVAAPPVDSISSYAFGSAPGQIYAAGQGLGVLSSRDGGQSWQAANRGLSGTAVVALAVDPSRSARIFSMAADADGVLGTSGLFATRNGGVRWRGSGDGVLPPLGGSFTSAQATLFVDPQQPASLLFGGHIIAARSADGGATWSQLTFLPACLDPSTLAPEPSAPSVLFAAGKCFSPSCSAWKSEDSGVSWACLDLAHVQRIVVAPSDPQVLYALTFEQFPALAHAIWRSTDAGATWKPADAGLPVPLAEFLSPPNLVVDPGNAQRLFFGLSTGVWRSLDGGAHWSETDKGMPLAQASDFQLAASPVLAIDPANPQLVYAGASYLGVYRSSDGGNHWQPILAGLPPLNPFYGEADFYEVLVPDPSRSGTVYLATWGNGILVYSSE